MCTNKIYRYILSITYLIIDNIYLNVNRQILSIIKCNYYLCTKNRVIILENRIKDLREDNDLTQQQIADKIGITQRKYSYIETGIQPLTDEILVKLAAYYDVSIDYLLKQTSVKERYK